MEAAQLVFMTKLYSEGREAVSDVIAKIFVDNAQEARDMGPLSPTAETAIHQVAIGVIHGALALMDITEKEQKEIADSVLNVIGEYMRRNGGTVLGRENI